MEQFKDFIEKCPHENVKTKALDLLQSWAYAFRNIQRYRPVSVRVSSVTYLANHVQIDTLSEHEMGKS